MGCGSGLGGSPAELCVVGGLGAPESQSPSPQTTDPEVALGALSLPDSSLAPSVGLNMDPRDVTHAGSSTHREREVDRKALGRSVGHPPSDNWSFSKCMEGNTGQK